MVRGCSTAGAALRWWRKGQPTSGRWTCRATNGSQYKYFINGIYWWKDLRSRRDAKRYNTNANSIVYSPNA
jgi:hypothetical protein